MHKIYNDFENEVKYKEYNELLKKIEHIKKRTHKYCHTNPKRNPTNLEIQDKDFKYNLFDHLEGHEEPIIKYLILACAELIESNIEAIEIVNRNSDNITIKNFKKEIDTLRSNKMKIWKPVINKLKKIDK